MANQTGHSKGEMERVFKHSIDILSVTKMDGSVVLVNPAFEKAMGFSASEITNKPFWEVFHPAERNVAVAKLEMLAKGEGAQTFESKCLCKDGSHKWIEWTTSSDIQLKRLYFFGRNVTLRILNEVDLIEAKELAEKKTSLRDKFVGLVSHDLMAPLASMISFLRLFRDHFDTLSCPDKRYRMLDSAIRSGERMRAFILDLLNLTRLRTGKIIPKFNFFNVQSLWVDAFEEFLPLAENKKIQLTNHMPEKTRVYGDLALLREVVKNLIANSIKFCNAGDSITIFEKEGKFFSLAVSDTGIGIKPERMPDICKYEIQTTTPGTQGEKGSGLGLPMSKDIMLAHGGDLVIESEPGKGSVFYMLLPKVKPIVLIVDDDPHTSEFISLCIQNLNVDIIEAENGKKAMEVLKRTPIHLIVTDLLMPEIDGFELLRSVKKDVNLSNIPVIAVTSDGNIKTRDKAFKLGADDFVAKPITLEDLNPRVKRFVG